MITRAPNRSPRGRTRSHASRPGDQRVARLDARAWDHPRRARRQIDEREAAGRALAGAASRAGAAAAARSGEKPLPELEPVLRASRHVAIAPLVRDVREPSERPRAGQDQSTSPCVAPRARDRARRAARYDASASPGSRQRLRGQLSELRSQGGRRCEWRPGGSPGVSPTCASRAARRAALLSAFELRTPRSGPDRSGSAVGARRLRVAAADYTQSALCQPHITRSRRHRFGRCVAGLACGASWVAARTVTSPPARRSTQTSLRPRSRGDDIVRVREGAAATRARSAGSSHAHAATIA